MLPFPAGRTDIHKKDFFIPPEAQMRHTAIFGKSSTGKSTLMRNMMVWDIHNDVGLTALDPHADLISEILDNIPKRRAGDVIYLNLLDPERAIGISPLQPGSGSQKPLVENRFRTAISTFKKALKSYIFNLHISIGFWTPSKLL